MDDLIQSANRAEASAIVDCLARLDPSAPRDYRELAALLACEWRAAPPRRVGLAGGQGTGKSTLAGLLEQACAAVGLRACALPLDDFYLTQAERRALAGRVHPLLVTRGPPGTHDMARCLAAVQALGGAGPSDAAEPLALPVFDKGLDDRVGHRSLRGPFDVVVLEGWCVGARAVAEESLHRPVNALERDEDRDGRWRRFVNARLASDYQPVWDRLDLRILLQAPSIDAVRRWRLEQEAARPSEQRWDAPAIDRFVQHFERITRSMLEPGFEGADLIVQLDEAHRVAGLSSLTEAEARVSRRLLDGPSAGGGSTGWESRS
jgi:D-glycerate 3-kinase